MALDLRAEQLAQYACGLDRRAAARLHTCWRVVSLSVLFMLCYVYVLAGTYSPFLYFRF